MIPMRSTTGSAQNARNRTYSTMRIQNARAWNSSTASFLIVISSWSMPMKERSKKCGRNAQKMSSSKRRCNGNPNMSYAITGSADVKRIITSIIASVRLAILKTIKSHRSEIPWILGKSTGVSRTHVILARLITTRTSSLIRVLQTYAQRETGSAPNAVRSIIMRIACANVAGRASPLKVRCNSSKDASKFSNLKKKIRWWTKRISHRPRARWTHPRVLVS